MHLASQRVIANSQSTQITEGQTAPNPSYFIFLQSSLVLSALAAVKLRVAEVLGNKMRRPTEKQQQ